MLNKNSLFSDYNLGRDDDAAIQDYKNIKNSDKVTAEDINRRYIKPLITLKVLANVYLLDDINSKN